MNILYVNYGDFSSSSLNHISIFANALVRQGHSCLVAIPSGQETRDLVANRLFDGLTYASLLETPAAFPDGRPADLIHGWTPRECIRKCITAYQARLPRPVPLVLHLEDNEPHLAESFAGRPLAQLRRLPPAELASLLPDALPHPIHCRSFLHFADAVTHLSEPLAEHVPAGLQRLLLPPGLDPVYLETPPHLDDLRRQLGLDGRERILVYTGSNTFANDHEIRELYRAVLLLNQKGVPTRLVRTGIIPKGFLQSFEPALIPHITELGFVPKAELPRLLALADALVQPGSPGPFNDFRLPSKLPEFLASGRPVITPRSNIALKLRDGEEALFLPDGSAEAIVACCERLFQDPALAARIGAAGARFARDYFDPARRSRELTSLYLSLSGSTPQGRWNLLDGDPGQAPAATAGLLADRLRQTAADLPEKLAQAELAEDISLLARGAELDNLDLRAQRARLQKELAATQASLEKSLTELGETIATRNALAHDRQVLRTETEVLRGHLAEAHQAHDNAARRIKELDTALAATEAAQARAWAEHATVAARVTQLDAELRARDERLRTLKASLSWKLTAPLRTLQRLFGKRTG